MLWLILGPYIAVQFVAVRVLTGHLAWTYFENSYEYKRERLGKPNCEQWFGAFVVSCVCSCVWPLALVFTRIPLKAGAEAKADRRLKGERLKQLEREAGLV